MLCLELWDAVAGVGHSGQRGTQSQGLGCEAIASSRTRRGHGVTLSPESRRRTKQRPAVSRLGGETRGRRCGGETPLTWDPKCQAPGRGPHVLLGVSAV